MLCFILTLAELSSKTSIFPGIVMTFYVEKVNIPGLPKYSTK